ncbi:hypothetical protein L210DRAFT_951631 [Boletus edulis BED1]|uniref:Uncharacterized protein n=1 Tax=Boletus edulis BED1 TaxID=1328754 RepID=A0AAD4BJF1_BOLED|nr:hypothetical protein L210DRAFT_951631 [Boletus edulis BED1]
MPHIRIREISRSPRSGGVITQSTPTDDARICHPYDRGSSGSFSRGWEAVTAGYGTRES